VGNPVRNRGVVFRRAAHRNGKTRALSRQWHLSGVALHPSSGRAMGKQIRRKRSESATMPYLGSARGKVPVLRGYISLGARRDRRRERVATRFDSGNVAGQCTKENRFKGGNLQEFSLGIGKSNSATTRLALQ
jgi:hypothetical protein